MEADFPIEYAAPQDPYYNYCWWPYEPLTNPAGKLRPVSLLFDSFREAHLDPRAVQLVNTLRTALGLHRTVWGTKWIGQRLAWEFYFYDYSRRERDVSISRVLQAIRPFLPCRVTASESLPYFMFSLDVPPDVLAGRRELDVVHMYIGNPGSTVSSGIAYALRPDRTQLENFYFFFDARRDLSAAAAKIACSAVVDATRIDIDRILWPSLRNCRTICVANKPLTDTVYFSGVTVDQLLLFLRTLAYPPRLIHFIEQHRSRLDHLLYDVGFDYLGDGDQLRIVKSGYYNVF